MIWALNSLGSSDLDIEVDALKLILKIIKVISKILICTIYLFIIIIIIVVIIIILHYQTIKKKFSKYSLFF